jgi:hypothetical protein
MSGIVVDLFRDHGANHTDIIRHGSDMRKQIGNFDACFPVFLEARERTTSDEFVTLWLSELLAFGKGFRKRIAVDAIELRFRFC